MERVIKIQTFDGLLHDDTKAAMRHLDKLYGDDLSSIGHKLAALDGKYTKMVDWIDQNLQLFDCLLQIRADMEMDRGEDEEDPK